MAPTYIPQDKNGEHFFKRNDLTGRGCVSQNTPAQGKPV